MPITPNPPADFNKNFKPLGSFRFWCQKVLPLVYDDSLSYYELLCKVVDYLNKTMEDVESLNDAYNQLQEYVNNYFDSLDVTQEINNKLDEMATDGTLQNMLMDIMGEYNIPVFVSSLTDMKDQTKIYVYSQNGHIYFWNGSSFADSGLVYGITSEAMLSYGSLIHHNNLPFTDANNMTANKIYLISADVVAGDIANLPEYGVNTVLMTASYMGGFGGCVQIATTVNTNNTYFRASYASGTFTQWHKSVWDLSAQLTSTDILVNKGNLPFTDSTKAPINKIYLIGADIEESDISGLPYYGVTGVLSTFGYDPDNENFGGVTQMYGIVNNNITCFRTSYNSGSFSQWNTTEKILYDTDYPTLISLFNRAKTIGNCTVVITKDHNLVDEYTQAFFQNYTANVNNYGLPIGFGNTYIFQNHAKIICHLQPQWKDANYWFSPLYAWDSDFTVKNLHIQCSNCRYAVHEDPYPSGLTNNYNHAYIDSIIKFDNTNNGSDRVLMQAFGCGISPDCSLVIRGAILDCNAPTLGSTIGVHSTNYPETGTTSRSNVTITNVVNSRGGLNINAQNTGGSDYYSITNNYSPNGEFLKSNNGFSVFRFHNNKIGTYED